MWMSSFFFIICTISKLHHSAHRANSDFFFFFSKGADSKPTLPFSSFSLPLRAGRTEGRRRKWCPSALWSPDAIMSLLMSNKSFLPLTAGCVDVQYIVLIVNTSCGFRMIDNWFWLHANLKQSNKKKNYVVLYFVWMYICICKQINEYIWKWARRVKLHTSESVFGVGGRAPEGRRDPILGVPALGPTPSALDNWNGVIKTGYFGSRKVEILTLRLVSGYVYC